MTGDGIATDDVSGQIVCMCIIIIEGVADTCMFSFDPPPPPPS